MMKVFADQRRAKAAAFAEVADHLDRLAELADGPNVDVVVLTLRPAAQTFRLRAARELDAAARSEERPFASGGLVEPDVPGAKGLG